MKAVSVLLVALVLAAAVEACVFESDNVVVHGDNANGQLGLGFSSCAIATPFQPDFDGATIVDAAFTSTAAFFLTSNGEVRRSQNGVISVIGGVSAIKALSAGADHVLMLDDSGKVFAMGSNNNGQLGLGDVISRTTPTLIASLSDVSAVSAGSSHSIFMTRDGRVFVTGNNANGQLALGNTLNINAPTRVEDLVHIVSISAGKTHSLFVNKEGSVFVAGSNANGESCLGSSSSDNVLSATRIRPSILLKTIVKAAAGDHSSFILTEEGRVYSCGLNANGILGLGDTNDRNVPTIVPEFLSVPVSHITVGASTAQFLTQEGKVFTSGSGKFGAIGLGDFSNALSPVLRDSLQNHSVCSLSHGVESHAVAALLGHQ